MQQMLHKTWARSQFARVARWCTCAEQCSTHSCHEPVVKFSGDTVEVFFSSGLDLRPGRQTQHVCLDLSAARS